MDVKYMMNELLESRDITQEKAARLIGWTPNKLSQRLIRNTLRVSDFMAILDAMKIEVEYKDAETGEPLALRKHGYGQPIKGASDGIKFDTEKSDALSNSFYADGENEYGSDGRAAELYIDKEGRYFFAEYTINEEEHNRVRSTTEAMATAFIEKYGTDLHKDRK